MSRQPDRLLSRLALIGALAAALALGACGRKGPLDPPPSATSATGQAQPTDTNLIRSPFESNQPASKPAPPPDLNRKFILDPLLN